MIIPIAFNMPEVNCPRIERFAHYPPMQLAGKGDNDFDDRFPDRQIGPLVSWNPGETYCHSWTGFSQRNLQGLGHTEQLYAKLHDAIAPLYG
jgi:hypothetical protein